MTVKKIIALVLSAALSVCLFSGCGKDGGKEEDGERGKLMMTVDDTDIYEDYFEYFYNYYKTNLENSYGDITDWTKEVSDGYTYQQYVIDATTNWFIYSEAVRVQANRLGVGFNEEDQAALDEDWNSVCEQNGGEEEFIKYLEEQHCTKELYAYISSTDLIAQKCFNAMYDENGENVSDEDCAEHTADDGYLMAKHILILTTETDAEGNSVALSDEEKAQRLEKAESILTQLDQCSTTEELYSRFDQLMNEYSEDTGLANFPDGYLFQEGDMVTEFYEGTLALNEGEYSGIVETSYGYHIILRIPINYDVIPMAYSSYMAYGYNYTLRYIVAEDMFNSNANTWLDTVDVTYTDAYNEIDLNSYFAVG